MLQLSPRLAAVAGFVLPDLPLADIGTDHAYLPVHLVRTGVVPRAVAADVSAGPLGAARQTVESAGLSGQIDLRLGDGLSVLRPGEVGTVTICGMGGPLIADLLAAAPPEVLAGIRRLVLQPMAGEDTLRRRLVGAGWRLHDEELVEEDGRIYPIVVAAPGRCRCELGEADAVLGPHLRRRGGPLFQAYAAGIVQRLEAALDGARAARSHAGQQRADELERRKATVLAACSLAKE